MEEKYTETLYQKIEDKKLHYGENLRDVIDIITKKQGAIDIDDHRVFGKHIHAFCWAFYTGVFYNKKKCLKVGSILIRFLLGPLIATKVPL